MTALSIVVPCYNEEAVLPATREALLGLLAKMTDMGLINAESGIYFVDDGSSDNTWSLIEQYAAASDQVHGIKLSANRGHQNALLAGLLNAPGDVLVSIDADLQDDPETIIEMVRQHQAGCQVVYGVREDRSSDSVFKRKSAEWFYSLMQRMGVNVIHNHADFRLVSRTVVTALAEFGEANLFLRGLIPSIGYQSGVVTYTRGKRVAGESKYPLVKMIGLAVNGITSYSVVPLRIISALGILIFTMTLVLSGWVMWVRVFEGTAIPGWASSVLPMYLLGGIQLLSLGVIGEYLGKTYVETKRRPRFFIEKQTQART